jgi:hypothetical protein
MGLQKITLAVIISLSAFTANAVPVVWTLDNVTAEPYFPAGPSVSITGQFTYDADTNMYSNVHIFTPFIANSEFSEFTAEVLHPDHPELNAQLFIVNGSYPSGDPAQLGFSFADLLTNAGGEVAIEYGELFNFGHDGGGSAEIFIGSVTAVPVPAAVWLFGSALAGLGWMRRKQPV